MKKNVWHSIEQRTIDASIDRWHSLLKTRICAEGGQFKQKKNENEKKRKLICVEKKQGNNILRKHLP